MFLYSFPWSKIKKLYLRKFTESIETFNQKENLNQTPIHDNILCIDLKDKILERMNSFYK
jgi:hypothetical protein